MRIKHIIIAIAIALSLGNTLNAQNTSTMYFMENIAERNNMNPAFIPNCNFYFDFIVLPNLYMNMETNGLVFNDLLYKQNGIATSFLAQSQIDNFYNSLAPSTRLSFNTNINILSFGFRIKKHYFTFDAGVKAEADAYIPQDVFKLALYGTPDKNGVNTFNFSRLGVEASLYSNVGVGYMYKINDKWQVGAKAKFLIGYANIDTRIDNLQLEASRQEWNLHAEGNVHASLPVTFEQGDNGTTASLHSTKDILSLLYKPAGFGGAIDLGATYQPIKNLTVSASITDLGFIRWKRNTINGQMSDQYLYDGFLDYTLGDSVVIAEQVSNTFSELGSDILSTIDTSNEKNPYTTMLRANFYTGVEYGILDNQISFGAVNRLTFNNRRVEDEVTLAVNFRPLHWLKTTVDYSFINGRGANIGFGINLRASVFNMYIMADYIPLSYAKMRSSEWEKPVVVPNRTERFNIQFGMALNIGNYTIDSDRDGVRGKKDLCPETDMDFLRSKCPELKKKKEFVDKNGCDWDDDKDGIHNCYDACPNTPEGVTVDSIGCPVDTDKDGVCDYKDKCPDTPEGVEVDTIGCPFDTDKDGVYDYIDQCPDTPEGVEVDSIGCPVDTDKDGVANNIDQCPDTPEGVAVDSVGCPIDSDNDGTPDYLDKCPKTAGVGTNKGCPELTAKELAMFPNINFDLGKTYIKAKYRTLLNKVVQAMKANPEYQLIIKGHCDIVGTEERNKEVSLGRAENVAKYLIEKGVEADRLTTQSFSYDKPIADNTTAKGRAKNRRVEFEVTFK